MDWITFLAPPLVGLVFGVLGYYLRGKIDRRNVPETEADKKVLSEMRSDRAKLVARLDADFSDLNHWVRKRIPELRKHHKEPQVVEYLERTEKTAMQVRSAARHARGIKIEEREELIRVVVAETDAILRYITEYQSNREPALDNLEKAGANRRKVLTKLEGKIPS